MKAIYCEKVTTQKTNRNSDKSLKEHITGKMLHPENQS